MLYAPHVLLIRVLSFSAGGAFSQEVQAILASHQQAVERLASSAERGGPSQPAEVAVSTRQVCRHLKVSARGTGKDRLTRSWAEQHISRSLRPLVNVVNLRNATGPCSLHRVELLQVHKLCRDKVGGDEVKGLCKQISTQTMLGRDMHLLSTYLRARLPRWSATSCSGLPYSMCEMSARHLRGLFSNLQTGQRA